MSLKGGRDTPIDAVDTILSACCFVSCLRFVLLSVLSLNDDSESNILEGIQNSGVAGRSEGDIMNKG